MTAIEILGYIGAVAIGVSLGLIGGGGSILTVPVLVYLLGVSPVLATAYSLFIVGFSSLIGGIKYARQGLVNFKTGLIFAIPAFLSVYLTRRYLMPWLPDVWLSTDLFTLSKDTGILLLFAILMVAASISMIRQSKTEEVEGKNGSSDLNFIAILIEGAVVGMLTGLVGAGGGFLIIPALVLFAKLPMKMAIGTSLLIIAVKSLLGFIGDIQAGENIDWPFLLIISTLAGLGIFIGMFFSKKVNGAQLKKGFGWFVLVMGVFMILKETMFK
ncbi:sulfite exporter TauE/SafE family protein [Fulvivirga sp.]|uniref:sulfite exporter TauE/SafE family protein n=1 Tax=Fulvivirga sp. TaxID=1931237 RepID=UPI0032EE5D4C